MSQQQKVQDRFDAIQARIRSAEKTAGRASNSVTLIGASKQQPADLIAKFHHAGLRNCGENYLQESIEKQRKLTELDIKWHFIGQIQSNKTKAIAEHFTWVHSVDRLKIAQRLAKQSAEPIKLLIQLNVDNEGSKGGIAIHQAAALANEIAQLENAQIRGFMAIPKASQCIDKQKASFASVFELLEHTNQRFGLALDQLSMGMSGDLETAIHEGSTMVRIGSDLFGARK